MNILSYFENWKNIEDYENYSVSNFGRVRNDDTDRILKSRINNHGYKYVNLYTNGKSKTLTVHKLVANSFIENPENKLCIDHKNRNTLDNYLSNLRWATRSENMQNKSKMKNNTSGFIGVSFCKRSNKWVAYYTLNSKRKHIGYYETKELASEAYQAKIKIVFGEFANV